MVAILLKPEKQRKDPSNSLLCRHPLMEGMQNNLLEKFHKFSEVTSYSLLSSRLLRERQVDDASHMREPQALVFVKGSHFLQLSLTCFNTASPSTERVDPIYLAHEQRHEADLLGNVTWRRLHFYYYLH